MRELELPDVQDVMLEYRKIKLLYRSALKEIGTKLEILNDEFKLVHQYNPIEHIESRLKTDESITRKLIRKRKETISLGSGLFVLLHQTFIES